MSRQAYLELIGGKARNDAEEQMQMAIVDLLIIAARTEVIWFHVPNGGKRSKASAGKLKAMGVKAGVPDLVFIVPVKGEPPATCFLELKDGARGKLSPAQVQFQIDCERLGLEHAVAYNFDQAVAIIAAWGVLRNDVTL